MLFQTNKVLIERVMVIDPSLPEFPIINESVTLNFNKNVDCEMNKRALAVLRREEPRPNNLYFMNRAGAEASLVSKSEEEWGVGEEESSDSTAFSLDNGTSNHLAQTVEGDSSQ